MNVKKTIKGIAKTAGKYTLKGIGKATELVERGTVKTVNALVKNPNVQEIDTSAGRINSEVTIPAVETEMIGVVGLKYMKDRASLENDKSLIEEIGDIIKAGNVVTKSAREALSNTLEKTDKGIERIGQKGQDKLDDLFR